MILNDAKTNAEYLGIILVLKELYSVKQISLEEYKKAKLFYLKLLGADLTIVD